MPSKRPGETPIEEVWDFTQRSLAEPREWLELDTNETWDAFIDDALTGNTGLPVTDMQRDFFGQAPQIIRQALSDIGFGMSRAATPAGVEFMEFRDLATGRFVGLADVRAALQGYFYGL